MVHTNRGAGFGLALCTQIMEHDFFSHIVYTYDGVLISLIYSVYMVGHDSVLQWINSDMC